MWERSTADGVFIKQMYLAKAGTLVPQHAHVYDHVTLVAHGKVRVWADGEYVGDFAAPETLLIPAKVKHTIQALEDGTCCYCIHNISRSGSVEIHEAHRIA